MKKNVASQIIGAQMVSATDGSAFTGAVTCYVTGNGGTQALGSVGSGVCTHEGNGFHTYAPSQAETNYDHVAFTFIGTGAVPATVQVFTGFPQTGDAYTRVLNDLDAAGVRAAVGLASANLDTQLGTIPDAADIRASIGLAAANLDTQLADLPTVAEFNARTLVAANYFDPAVDTVTVGTNNDKTGYSVSNVSEIAGAVFDEAVLGHDIADTFGELLVGVKDSTVTLESGQGALSAQISDVSAVTSRLNTAMELDGAVYRFTVNALEQAPVGGGGGTADWTADEKTAIRTILGIPASGAVPETPADGALSDLLTGVADLPTVAEFEARTKLADDYFDPATDTARANLIQIDGLATNGNNATLRLKGLDIKSTGTAPAVRLEAPWTVVSIISTDASFGRGVNIVTASTAGVVCTTGDLSFRTISAGVGGFDASTAGFIGNLTGSIGDTRLDDIPTNAEFAARTRLAEEYATPTNVDDAEAAIIAAIGTGGATPAEIAAEILATPANKLATNLDGSVNAAVTGGVDVDEQAIADAVVEALDFDGLQEDMNTLLVRMSQLRSGVYMHFPVVEATGSVTLFEGFDYTAIGNAAIAITEQSVGQFDADRLALGNYRFYMRHQTSGADYDGAASVSVDGAGLHTLSADVLSVDLPTVVGVYDWFFYAVTAGTGSDSQGEYGIVAGTLELRRGKKTDC
jgi:hypothetical protein